MAEDEIVNTITDSMDENLSKLWKIVENRGAWHAAVQGLKRVIHNLATEQQKRKKKKGKLM